jgi:hypothetical protein
MLQILNRGRNTELFLLDFCGRGPEESDLWIYSGIRNLWSYLHYESEISEYLLAPFLTGNSSAVNWK